MEAADRARKAMIAVGIDARVTRPIMGAEDFAFYTRVKPGVYFTVGTHNPDDPATSFPPHNPYFCIDERAMMIALKALIAVWNEMSKVRE